jgi:hypothetical protein
MIALKIFDFRVNVVLLFSLTRLRAKRALGFQLPWRQFLLELMVGDDLKVHVRLVDECFEGVDIGLAKIDLLPFLNYLLLRIKGKSVHNNKLSLN